MTHLKIIKARYLEPKVLELLSDLESNLILFLLPKCNSYLKT